MSINELENLATKIIDNTINKKMNKLILAEREEK